MIFDDKYTTARPYIAGYILLRKGKKFAALLRGHTGWMDGYYGLPSGKIEYGEPFSLGALREAEEEVGVKVQLKNLKYVHTVHRHGDDGKKFIDWVDLYFETSVWEGDITNREPAIHDAAEWLDLANLPDNIIPSVKAALEAIARGETYSEYGWQESGTGFSKTSRTNKE